MMTKEVKLIREEAVCTLSQDLYKTFRKRKELFGERVDTPYRAIKVARQIVYADPLLDRLDERAASRLRRYNMIKEKQSEFFAQRESKPLHQISKRKIETAMYEIELINLDLETAS